MSCRTCSGSGVVEKDGKAFECECAFVRRMATTMPAFIRRADVRKEHIEQPFLTHIKRSILIISSWIDMKSCIKAAMIMNPKKFIKITSDREIRDVFVGSKSKAARGDEDGAIYNSLEDLMDAPDLSIVRLNELSYKNKAASGALEEAICYRIDRDKPVWLFSDVDKPFTAGSHAYSDSVADVIKSNFPMVRVPRILTVSLSLEDEPITPQFLSASVSKPITDVENDPTTYKPQVDPIEEPPQEPVHVSRPKPKIRPSIDEDAGVLGNLYGAGIKPKSKFKGR